MLDYAANAVVYWPVSACERRSKPAVPRGSIASGSWDLVGQEGDEDGDPEEFWAAAATNLRAGKVRLADEIPRELQRVWIS